VFFVLFEGGTIMAGQPTPNFQRYLLVGIAVAAALFVGAAAIASDGDISTLAEELAGLRSQVESLSADVEAKKDDIDARLRSTRAQKSDLELQIQRETTRLKQLRGRVSEHRDKIAEQKDSRQQLEPAVRAAVERIRANVEQSLPFKRAERLAELDTISEQLDQGLITPQKATSRLWQFVEDELRLARENGLYRQVIEVDGQEMLAEVARLGMVAVYFRTDDGRLGRAERADGAWRWTTLRQQQDRERVDHLFESFRKNIRVGYFEIPNALPQRGER
jgi:hypothetical protein